MNILASYAWLKEYVRTDLSPAEFAEEFSLRSMSVEKIDELKDAFQHMVVGVITEIKAHPNANKLRIAVTDIGAKTVEIVCGGSNIAVNQRVFVALPGAKVRWHGEGELIELQETEIRGVKSIGMICAPAEVGFEKLQGDEHEIWDLSQLTDAKPGTPVIDALELHDTVFDIEITSNRPDCMGMIGLAREAAAAVNGIFLPPKEKALPALPSTLPVSLESKLCSRYIAATVKHVRVAPSPWWLQKKLLLAGHRPINNIVDITNYVLHEYGQPLHAFDAGKIRGGKIHVRPAVKGEQFKALDGKEYTLSKQHLVIADDEGPLALAGVMGGEASGTTHETQTVVFEAATFDPVSVRKTARDLNLYSDSQLVFEKGLSTEALPPALLRALELAEELAGGEVTDITDVRQAPYKERSFATTTKKIRERIGVHITDEEIEQILRALGFDITRSGVKITAKVPYWRDHDIEAEVDLTEEVARMYGYHKLPAVLPALQASPSGDDASVIWELWLRKFAASAGYTEFFSLSLIDGKDLERYAISPKETLKVLNPLAEDLAFMRPSLIPSMLRSIERNQANVSRANVFELARVYIPQVGHGGETMLPHEDFRLLLGRYGFDDAEEAFRSLKGFLELLGKETAITFHINRLSDDAKWHQSRSAVVYIEKGPERIEVGTLGQVAHPFERAFGLETPVFLLDLDVERLLPHMKLTLRYAPVSEFPVSVRDLSFAVNERTAFEDLRDAATGGVTDNTEDTGGLVKSVELLDTYRGAGVEDGKKSVTLRLTFGRHDRTLTSEEVDYAVKKITGELEAKFGAVLRG